MLGLAGLAFVALQRRGPVVGDLAPASTPTVWALVGALVLVRILPPLVRRVLRRAGRSARQVPFFVAARVAAGGLRALPLVVVVVAVAELTFGSALAATQQRGQESGALLAVGGDARLRSVPAEEVSERAAAAGQAPGVRAAVAGRVADGTLVSSVSTGASVRLVVVDARAYQRLLAASDLPDAPQLERLAATSGEDAPVPALLLGGPSGLEDGLQLRWGGDVSVALAVVGEAPRVGATTGPVVVVDAAAFAAAGASADPDTIWAVGPGAPQALRTAAEADPADTVTTYDDVLTRLRDAPLPAALVHLAVAASLLLAGLGVVLGAAVDAPARATALGRLRSLGLADRDLRRVLAGELLVPVLASVLTGLVVGVVTARATFGSLGLEDVTGQGGAPQLVVPLWTGLAALSLPLVALVLAARTSRQLLRSGDFR
jgi:putative ABC transport system permease protein